MSKIQRAGLGGALVLTGFSALALQVVWQRLISLHMGADVVATATVVSGFLAGLGVGNLAGGRLADRSSPRGAIGRLAVAELGVALFAVCSPLLFHDLLAAVAARSAGTGLTFLAGFGLLLAPTTLMGLSLPLAAKAVTDRADRAGGRVGRLYAVNTLGGAAGALVSGWFLVGRFGFSRATLVCGAVGAAAVLLLGVVLRRPWDDADGTDHADGADGAAPEPVPSGAGSATADVRRWYALYAVAGALSLALQQAFFRMAGAIGRSNSYSFATVLAIYLSVFGLGVAAASRFVARVKDPRRTFLWLQCASGAAAMGSLVVLTVVLPAIGLGGRFDSWFASDGFASGYSESGAGDVVLFALLLPLLVVGPSVLCAGASFPFLEQVVVDRLGSVGRRTGGLVAANTFGNVVGVLLAAFVLFDAVGTAGIARFCSLALMSFGFGAAALAVPAGRGRAVRVAGVGLVAAALLVTTPTNQRLWSFFSGVEDPDQVLLAEDAACASVLKRHGDASAQLTINGTSQNGYPFDDFHVLIGLLPSLAASDPGEGIAIGYGVGSTSYAMLADSRRPRVTTVELCGGHYEVSDRYAEEGHPEFVELRDSPRHHPVTADGRHYLGRTSDRFDAVVVDTLRVTSAYSGQHFSREFYELVDSVMTDDGVFAQWVPTWRVLNSAALVFPHLVVGVVEEYGSSVFMLGSRSPIDVSGTDLAARFRSAAADAFEPEQRQRLEGFFGAWQPTCITAGEVIAAIPEAEVNTDLVPRDEFHRHHGFIWGPQRSSACGPPTSSDVAILGGG